MKYLCLLFFVLMILVITACESNVDSSNNVMRSADPCETWSKASWQVGPAAITTPELRDGKASHLSPAAIIYYAIKENGDDPSSINAKYLINPVLVLTYLEGQALLSQSQDFGDFEWRLLEAWSIGGDKIKKYHGFYPQAVSATYQWRLYQMRALSFDSAQVLYPCPAKIAFTELYAKYAQTMNTITGQNYPLYPDSKGYYQDFAAEATLANIQKFLEIVQSPLSQDIFRQPPLANSAVDYSNNSAYCEL